MSAVYSTEELTALHKRALNDAAILFTAANDADFVRHLRVAGREIAKSKRPRTKVGALALVAGQSIYAAPDDLLYVKPSAWGTQQQHVDPWNQPRGPLPSLRRIEDPLTGLAQVLLTPAPTSAQMDAFGAYSYYYLAAHDVPDSGPSTISDRELDLLLLRAKVEAMRELAIRNSNKPVSLRGASGMGGDGMAKNATPPGLYDAFLREYMAAE